MRFVAAVAAAVCAFAFPAMGEPISYEQALAQERALLETDNAADGSDATPAIDAASLTPEQTQLMAEDADWRASARLYHAGGGGATGNDDGSVGIVA